MILWSYRRAKFLIEEDTAQFTADSHPTTDHTTPVLQPYNSSRHLLLWISNMFVLLETTLTLCSEFY